MKQGFTLIESVVVLALFVTGMVIISQLYLSLIRSVIQAQNLQLAVDNVRFGTEKLWNEIKSGSNFSVSGTSTLTFKDRLCRNVRVYYDNLNKNLVYEVERINSNLFDNNLVELLDFTLNTDTSRSTSTDAYYKVSKKFILMNFNFNLKTKNADIPYQFFVSVAPLTSVFSNSPCQ